MRLSSSPVAKESQPTRLRSVLPESDTPAVTTNCPAGVTGVHNKFLAFTESCFTTTPVTSSTQRWWSSTTSSDGSEVSPREPR